MKKVNPYPGPRPLTKDDRIYGRTVELRRLTNLLISERIILLYSPSGAGKTSLLQAGLLPRLDRAGFRVLGPVRPGMGLSIPNDGPANRYVTATVDSLRDRLNAPVDLPPSAGLADFFAALGPPPPKPFRLGAQLDEEENDSGEPLVAARQKMWQADLLVFDQFEEVLLADSADHQGRMAFFEQLGEVLRDRNRWALFSMREEHIAALDPYRRPIPTQLRTTFRLDLLGVPQAIEAIRGPAERADVSFPQEIAEGLARDLAGGGRGATDRAAGHSGAPDVESLDPNAPAAAAGRWVEPVQLQVVCQRIWDKLGPEETAISAHHLAEIGSVDEALEEYYAASVRDAAAKSGLRERRLREWIQSELITTSGVRNQFLWEQEAAPAAMDKAIRVLDREAHLVRAESRRDALWIELAHDRLVKPVLQNNMVWLNQTLEPFQKRALAWVQMRQSDLLLRGAALAEAEAWAKDPANAGALDDHPGEMEYLVESRQAEEQRMRARRQRILLVSALVLLALALFVGLGTALAQRDRSARQELSRRLGFDAAAVREREPKTALLLAAAALDSWDTFEARSSLIAALSPEEQPGATFQAQPRQDEPASLMAKSPAAVPASAPSLLARPSLSAVAISHEGEQIAAGSRDGAIYIWDLKKGESAPDIELPDGVSITRMAYAIGGGRLAVGDTDGNVWLFEVDGATLTPAGSFRAHPDAINGLAWGSGRLLFTVGKNDLAAWRVQGDRPAELARRPAPDARALALRPGNPVLVTAHADGRIAEWALRDDGSPAERPSADFRFEGSREMPSAVAASETGAIAVGYEGGLLGVWSAPADGPREFTVAGFEEGDITALEWGPRGEWFVSAGRDQEVVVWDPEGRGARARWRGHTGSVTALDLSLSRPFIVSAGDDGRLLAWPWPFDAVVSPFARQMPIHDDEVWAVDFSSAGAGGATLVATGGKDGRVLVSNVRNDGEGSLVVGEGLPPIRYVAFSPDGSRLAAADASGKIRLWTLETDGFLTAPVVYAHGDGDIAGLVFTEDALISAGVPDQGRLASQLKAWPLAGGDGSPLAAVEAPDLIMALARDGQGRIWTLDGASNLSAWKWDGAKRAFTLSAEYADSGDGSLYSLAVLDSGDLLAVGAYDGGLLLIDTTDNSRVKLDAHTDTVSAVAFSPHGDLLASASWDGQVLLWDVATRRQLGAPLRSGGLGLSDLAFSHDGRWLAVASDDRTLILYPATPEQWREAACKLAGREATEEERQRYFDGKDRQVCGP